MEKKRERDDLLDVWLKENTAMFSDEDLVWFPQPTVQPKSEHIKPTISYEEALDKFRLAFSR